MKELAELWQGGMHAQIRLPSHAMEIYTLPFVQNIEISHLSFAILASFPIKKLV
jgi:hypothetical protein